MRSFPPLTESLSLSFVLQLPANKETHKLLLSVFICWNPPSLLNKPRSRDQPPLPKKPTEILVRVCTGFILQEGNTETSLPSFCTPPNRDRKAGVTGLAFALTAGLPSFLPLLFSRSLRGSEDRYEHAKNTERRKQPCGFYVFCLFIVLFIVSTGCIETGKLTKTPDK